MADWYAELLLSNAYKDQQNIADQLCVRASVGLQLVDVDASAFGGRQVGSTERSRLYVGGYIILFGPRAASLEASNVGVSGA